jgi:hypothetical protein
VNFAVNRIENAVWIENAGWRGASILSNSVSFTFKKPRLSVRATPILRSYVAESIVCHQVRPSSRSNVAQMERDRIRATLLQKREDEALPLFFHQLQEPIDRAVADLTSVLDSVLYRFTEVNADENPRHTVLFRCLREALKRSQHL